MRLSRQAKKRSWGSSKPAEQCRAFPEELIEIVAVAEVSGQIPEVMIRQAAHYREEASCRLKTLTKFTGYGVYAFVALLMIVAIFKIASLYLGILNQV